MAAYYAHEVIKIQNLAKILSFDPFYSSSDNLKRVFFADGSIPTITSPIEMLYEWEARGLIPIDNSDIDVLMTRKYSIRSLQVFLMEHNLPLPGALFPGNDDNTAGVYFTQLAAKYLDTGNQTTFEPKRHRNDLLNKFFFNSEIVHREDYYQFETTPISQPEESDRIRLNALKEVQSVWLELKRNKFADELRIVQEWINEYLPSKVYFAQWKVVKELSEVDNRISEYESNIPGSIMEIDIRDRRLAELRERRLQLQMMVDVTNEASATDSNHSAEQKTDQHIITILSTTGDSKSEDMIVAGDERTVSKPSNKGLDRQDALVVAARYWKNNPELRPIEIARAILEKKEVPWRCKAPGEERLGNIITPIWPAPKTGRPSKIPK